MPSRRPFILLTCAISLILLLSLLFSSTPSQYVSTRAPIHRVHVDDSVLKGDAIMGKIGNETLKAELGRAAWRLLHTTMAKFPDKPTEDEQTALFSYIHLFARLYPCGECASHFRTILTHFPPQVSTRSAAAAWACHVHNEVNKSLGKEVWDCSNIGEFYDCGCSEEEGDGERKRKDGEGKGKGNWKGEKEVAEKEGRIDLRVQREGETAGG